MMFTELLRNKKVRQIAASIPVIIALSATGVSSAYALTKIYKELPSPNQEVVEIGEIEGTEDAMQQEVPTTGTQTTSGARTVTQKTGTVGIPSPTTGTQKSGVTTGGSSVKLASNTVSNPTAIPTAGSQQNGSTQSAGSGEFTTSTLAQHNKAGDCYIAFSGTVYDVSSQQSWSGCTHHGMSGGVDVTSRFPHPTSYLSALPVVGKMASGSTGTGSNTGTSGTTYQERHEDEHEDEHEEDHEDHEEYEDHEDEHED